MKFGKKEKITLVVGIIALVLILLIATIVKYIGVNKKIIFESEGIPKINIDKDESLTINNIIESLYQKSIENDMDFEYKIYDNDRYVSLVITTLVNDNEYNQNRPYYISYVIDKKTKKILSKGEISQLFNYTVDRITEIINNKFRKYYNDEIKLGYISSTNCDYENCYLHEARDIESIENNYILYIKDENLFGYVEFRTNSKYNDLKYFENLEPYELEF